MVNEMPGFLTSTEQANLLHMNSSSSGRYFEKKLIFEACLFMEGQTPKMREQIAHYYAEAIMQGSCDPLLVHIHQPHTNFKKNIDAHPNLIKFFKESIFNSFHYLPQFKLLLTDLEKKGTLQFIEWGYRHKDSIKRNLPAIDLKPINKSIDKLTDAVIPYRKKFKNKSRTQAIIVIVSSMALVDYAANASFMNNLIISCFIALLVLALNVLYRATIFANMLHKLLTISCDYIPDVLTDLVCDKKSNRIVALPAAVSSQGIFSEAVNTNQREIIENYRLTVSPSEPEETKSEVVRVPKRSRTIISSLLTFIHKSQEEKISASYFGEIFKDDDFVKLEGGSFGRSSQLYGIWHDIKLSCDNITHLHNIFMDGELISPKKGKGIKRLTGYGGKYFEVKGDDAGRVIGREFKAVNGKTVIVFVHYDDKGMHGGTNLDDRIIMHVNNIIANLHQIRPNNLKLVNATY